MIVVEMNLQSAISKSRNRTLGTVIISNDGKPTSERRHNYNVHVLNKKGVPFRNGEIRNWDREAKSPMQLLKAALESVGY